MMKRWLQRIGVLALFLALMGCADVGGGASANANVGALQTQGRDYFPGGHHSYAWGVSQSKTNFANVERAQWYYGSFVQQRTWTNMEITEIRATAQVIGLYAYVPLGVRWKLKDGREFILEGIDIRTLMRDYFKSHDIKMPWQNENRPYDNVGDYGPLLTHEVDGDSVRIKWSITTNHTPVDKRLSPKGAATLWTFSQEEYLVTTLKGKETKGIDFTKRLEIRNPGDKK